MSVGPRRSGLVAFWPMAIMLSAAGQAEDLAPVVRPSAHAHSHNDYWHERPLLDAIDRGFCSFEADIFLKDGELLVGHSLDELRPDRTLETLYLAPLRERIAANGGKVYSEGPTVFLLIDVRGDPEAAYAAIDGLLAKYDHILTKISDGKVEQRAVTVVISGNRAEETIRKQSVRYAGIDGRPTDLKKDDPDHVMPWISANWKDLFRWRGKGKIPEAERERLREHVRLAHRNKRLVRFWGTPDDEAVWRELLAANVDLIGTDDLPRLQKFLSSDAVEETVDPVSSP